MAKRRPPLGEDFLTLIPAGTAVCQPKTIGDNRSTLRVALNVRAIEDKRSTQRLAFNARAIEDNRSTQRLAECRARLPRAQLSGAVQLR